MLISPKKKAPPDGLVLPIHTRYQTTLLRHVNCGARFTVDHDTHHPSERDLLHRCPTTVSKVLLARTCKNLSQYAFFFSTVRQISRRYALASEPAWCVHPSTIGGMGRQHASCRQKSVMGWDSLPHWDHLSCSRSSLHHPVYGSDITLAYRVSFWLDSLKVIISRLREGIAKLLPSAAFLVCGPHT